jgi:hypothetical protein
MAPQAVDSFGIHTHASAQALAANGIVGALRYHYNTSRLEVDTLHAAGVAFGLIAEFDTATWHPPLHAPQTGGQHGVQAVKVAQALGMPQGCAISFTQDCYIPPQNRDAAVTYFSGAAIPVRAAGYRIMGYGDAFLMELCLSRGAIDLIWQAGADSWSQGRVAQHASLWQRVGAPVYGGVVCDPNTILRDDCGFWLPSGAQKPTTPTTPTPQDEDDDMALKEIWTIDTKKGHYVYDPAANTGVVLTPQQSTVLQSRGWPVKSFPAGWN